MVNWSWIEFLQLIVCKRVFQIIYFEMLLAIQSYLSKFTNCWYSQMLNCKCNAWTFYRTRVRSLGMLVTHSLTNCCLVNLIDATLACEDTNSKLVDVVTVADDDCVGNNLLQIWKLRFGQKAKILFRLWAQGLVKILKLKFRQDLKLEFGKFFSADVL